MSRLTESFYYYMSSEETGLRFPHHIMINLKDIDIKETYIWLCDNIGVFRDDWACMTNGVFCAWSYSLKMIDPITFQYNNITVCFRFVSDAVAFKLRWL